MVIRELGLESAKAVTTPGTSETSAEEAAREDSPLLGSREATSYRALAARLNYLAADRVDLQFATKCVAKHMSSTREHDWVALKRVGRYLRGSPRLIQMIRCIHIHSVSYRDPLHTWGSSVIHYLRL